MMSKQFPATAEIPLTEMRLRGYDEYFLLYLCCSVQQWL